MFGLAAWVVAVTAGCACAAVHGCSNGPGPQPPTNGQRAETPTMRLYLLSNLAGGLAPCGCSEDQLGGVDHLAAFLSGQQKVAPHRMLLAAGPMLFMNPALRAEAATQEKWKAETIAAAMKDMGLAAWVPGANDWAAGADTLQRQASVTGAVLLGAGLGAPSLTEAGLLRGHLVQQVGPLKVGVVGISAPTLPVGQAPDGVTAPPPEGWAELARAELAELKKEGAQLFVAVVAAPRGPALRIADALPELHVLLVGQPHSSGDIDDAPKPPILIGSTLVVQTPNHGQAVAVVDIHVRDGTVGPLVLGDGGAIVRAEQMNSLAGRIRKLESRINGWERGGHVDPKDLAARRAELEQLRAERVELEQQAPPAEGNTFRYVLQEVREELGDDPQVTRRMSALYRRINEHNKQAFADRKPEPAGEGEPTYMGLDNCTSCHQPARKHWDSTAHGRAYATLQNRFREYDLDCVGCHVTGYGKRGGSTVTHNDQLRNVGCEECHGPGSLHSAKPYEAKLIINEREPRWCVDACHHPPHVDDFDAATKMSLVLGPGHGEKE